MQTAATEEEGEAETTARGVLLKDVLVAEEEAAVQAATGARCS
jgi:hypothetical protein